MRWISVLSVCLALAGSAAWSALAAWKSPPPIIAPEGEDAAVEQILTALARPAIGWEFLDSPLPDFARWLEQELQVPVRIDELALRGAQIERTTPINCQLLPRLARDVALTRVLGPHELTWDIVDGQLVITTTAAFLPRGYTRLYAVRDLVQLRDAQGSYHDGEALVSTITSCVDAAQWEQNGLGNSQALYMPATHCLAVSAPFATQQKVERLLQSLRTLRAEQGGGVTFRPRPPASPMVF